MMTIRSKPAEFFVQDFFDNDSSEVHVHAGFPKEFPCIWAGEWGEDDFGLWQTLILYEVEQVDGDMRKTFAWWVNLI